MVVVVVLLLLEMKSFSLKSVKVCVSKNSVGLCQPYSLVQGRRKVKLLEEWPYLPSIGNGDYFWTSKDTLWDYVQTLSGKESLATHSVCFLKHWKTRSQLSCEQEVQK